MRAQKVVQNVPHRLLVTNAQSVSIKPRLGVKNARQIVDNVRMLVSAKSAMMGIFWVVRRPAPRRAKLMSTWTSQPYLSLSAQNVMLHVKSVPQMDA